MHPSRPRPTATRSTSPELCCAPTTAAPAGRSSTRAPRRAPRALLALSPSRVLLIGPTGLLRSTNGGQTFARVQTRVARSARVVNADRAGSAVFAWGARSLIWSRNGAKTWRKLKRPTRSALATVDFVTARLGFALAADGRVWKTRNGARSWRELTPIGTGDAVDLSFGGPRQGWLALRSFAGEGGGHLLRTSDQGRTWRPQLVDDDAVGRGGIASTGRYTGFLLAGPNSLLTTTNGGDQGELTSLRITTSEHRISRAKRVRVRGKLSPAEGGERVVVSMRRKSSRRWAHTVVTVASSGSFTTTWRVTGTSYFVAQWSGDDDRAGAGSRQLTVNRR